MQEVNQAVTIVFVNVNHFRVQSPVSVYSLFHTPYIIGCGNIALAKDEFLVFVNGLSNTYG